MPPPSPLLILALALAAAALSIAWVHARRDTRRAQANHKEDRKRMAAAATRSAAHQRRIAELEATLGSMAEGVVVVGPGGRIREFNPAAATLLELHPARDVGQPFAQRVRNAALQRTLDTALGLLPTDEAADPGSAEVTLRHAADTDHPDRHLRVEAAAVTDEQGVQHGAVLVLHDLTHLRHLEAVRQDFVANVSHELRTPVSAIKGAVEALRSDPPPDPDQRDRFIGIAARQSDRLEAILADLLTLTQLDTHEPAAAAVLPIGPSIAAAVESCSANAQAHGITLDVTVADNLAAQILPPRFEQALVNLIDNAVKYGPDGSRVAVTAAQFDDEVRVAVQDQGRGIEAHHHARLFERFYRTDRARSRQLGGTGLGLSIVKHIVEQVGGRVSLQSAPGRGSTFTLHLPATDGAAPDR